MWLAGLPLTCAVICNGVVIYKLDCLKEIMLREGGKTHHVVPSHLHALSK